MSGFLTVRGSTQHHTPVQSICACKVINIHVTDCDRIAAEVAIICRFLLSDICLPDMVSATRHVEGTIALPWLGWHILILCNAASVPEFWWYCTQA